MAQRQLVWEQRWRERVEAWRRSGQRQQEYCRAHGISASSFSHWKSELSKRDQLRVEAGAAGRVTAGGGATARGSEALRWSEVRLPAAASGLPVGQEGSGFEIVLPRGWSVRLGPGFEVEPLRRLLAVLSELPC
jgi:hypothetical protein